MFGFLIGGIVNDDAVRLKTMIDIVINKYGNLPIAEIADIVSKDIDFVVSYLYL